VGFVLGQAMSAAAAAGRCSSWRVVADLARPLAAAMPPRDYHQKLAFF